jgi:uncharacterized protein (TIGR03437 family)
VETSEGVYDWSRLDAWVAYAQQQGVDIVLTIDDTPQWASSNPGDTNCKFTTSGNGGCDMPANLKTYTDYLTTLATRYKGAIKYYEGWNESNTGWSAPGARTAKGTKYFNGTNYDLVTLQQLLYQTVKSIDSNALVVSPSFTGQTQGLTDAATLLGTPGACSSFDILGFHFYTSGAPPEVIPVWASQLTQSLANICGAKPIWDTETAWNLPASFPGLSAPGYLARAYVLAWISGVQRLYWYAFNDVTFDVFFLNDPKLLTSSSHQIHLDSPGWAYVKLQSWLVGNSIQGCSAGSGGFYTCNITDPNGNSLWMVWYAGPTTGSSTNMFPFEIPATWNVQSAEDINGNRIPLDSTALIGPNPVLFSSLPAAGPQVSAASFNSDFHAPDSLVTAFGTNLAGTTAHAAKLLPSLGGTSIDVLDASGNHTAAIPLFVSPGQVNYWLPASVAPGTATVTITSSSGTPTQNQIRVTTVAPAIFIEGSDLQGPPAAFVDYVNGSSQTLEPAYRCSGQACSALPINLTKAPTTILELYVTGVRNTYQSVYVQIGGVRYPVTYAGLQSQFAGLDQVNVVLPKSLAGSGALPVTLIVDTQISNTVNIDIQ